MPAAEAARPHPFAPYVDLAGYPPPDLTTSPTGGVRHVTLGFVVADGGTRCSPARGGYLSSPAAGRHAYRLANVRALRRAGGDVVPSFGGQAGTELASACPTVTALTNAYGRDRPCARPSSTTQLDCSGVGQRPWAFSRTLGAFTG